MLELCELSIDNRALYHLVKQLSEEENRVLFDGDKEMKDNNTSLRLYKNRQAYQLQLILKDGGIELLSGILTMEEMFHFLCGRLSLAKK